VKAIDLHHIFNKELGSIYEKNEIDSLFFLSLEHICKVARIQLQLEPKFTINKSETNQFFETLELLKQQKPIQYIFGETEFFGLNFKLNESVLIPRQETEELIDLIIKTHITGSKKNLKPLRILDIGTGSGCIAISLAKNLSNVDVYALDVSSKAIEVAKKNTEHNGVNVTFIQGNILDKNTWNSDFLNSEFDIIVSNPPYVRNSEKIEIQPNVLDNEPHLALFVSDENPLIFYKEIVEFSKSNLKSNGSLYFEINQYLGKETEELLDNSKFKNIELLKDLNGNDRMLKGIKK